MFTIDLLFIYIETHNARLYLAHVNSFVTKRNCKETLGNTLY